VRRPVSLGAAVVLAALMAGLAGCATGGERDSATSPSTTAVGPQQSGELTVYAAASLQSAFDELATRFEQRHPSVDVQPITYDGSSTLATQIIHGAPADVFASADEATMQQVVENHGESGPQVFATNTLVLAVPAGNPGAVDGLADLARSDLTVVLCAPAVPCGAASGRLLSNARIEASADSYEQNVTAVLTKVAAGEADAGLVYVTDAISGAVDTIEVDGAADVVNRYPIVALREAANPRAAEAFVAFGLGDEGREVLSGLGFGVP
jgi:molybdate transport system substrate-binding protein